MSRLCVGQEVWVAGRERRGVVDKIRQSGAILVSYRVLGHDYLHVGVFAPREITPVSLLLLLAEVEGKEDLWESTSTKSSISS